MSITKHALIGFTLLAAFNCRSAFAFYQPHTQLPQQVLKTMGESIQEADTGRFKNLFIPDGVIHVSPSGPVKADQTADQLLASFAPDGIPGLSRPFLKIITEQAASTDSYVFTGTLDQFGGVETKRSTSFIVVLVKHNNNWMIAYLHIQKSQLSSIPLR